MISNLPDDVVHDLLRDLGCTQMSGIGDEGTRCLEFYFHNTKKIIEQWEEKRDKYLESINRQKLLKRRSAWADSADAVRLPDGSGFIVP